MSPAAVFRVVIADRHPMMRAGLRAVLATDPQLDVCAEAPDRPALAAALQMHRPEVVVLAAELGSSDGPALVRAVADWSPDTQVVYLMLHPSAATRNAVLAAGAHACLLKDAGGPALLEAVRAAGGASGVLSAPRPRAEPRTPSGSRPPSA